MTNNYNNIYAPWTANPGTLLDLAGWKPGQYLLDLAGGTGVVSEEAWRRTKGEHLLRTTTRIRQDFLHLLDLNPRVRPGTFVLEKTGRAESVGYLYEHDLFNVVVCRQAVGYLDMEKVVPGVHRVLKPGGVFVFNSFEKPSPFGIRFKETEGGTLQNRHDTKRTRFAEAYTSLFGHVFHLQVRLTNGPDWDVTYFKYHDSEKLKKLLGSGFSVQMFKSGRSLRWLCRKGGI